MAWERALERAVDLTQNSLSYDGVAGLADLNVTTAPLCKCDNTEVLIRVYGCNCSNFKLIHYVRTGYGFLIGKSESETIGCEGEGSHERRVGDLQPTPPLPMILPTMPPPHSRTSSASMQCLRAHFQGSSFVAGGLAGGLASGLLASGSCLASGLRLASGFSCRLRMISLICGRNVPIARRQALCPATRRSSASSCAACRPYERGILRHRTRWRVGGIVVVVGGLGAGERENTRGRHLPFAELVSYEGCKDSVQLLVCA